jgi:hypothetical protein
VCQGYDRDVRVFMCELCQYTIRVPLSFLQDIYTVSCLHAFFSGRQHGVLIIVNILLNISLQLY